MSHAKFPRCAIGNRYGRLVVLELISMPKNARALCQCDCGTKVTRQRGALVRGNAISCGCIELENSPLHLLLKAIAVETDECIAAPMKANVNGGYGALRYEGRNERAHRLAYVHAKGLKLSDITGKDILHSCDNPPCINPRHLREGTHLDNMKDMYAKGRRQAAVGERAANVKLTEQQVREIRRRLATGESDSSIARDFPVERGQIRYIRVGRSWSHVK